MANNIQLKETDDLIVFVNEDQVTIYDIPIHRLGEDIKIDGRSKSYWIQDLLERMWVKSEMLYELAVIINKYFPDSDFNWYDEFFTVEKKEYLET